MSDDIPIPENYGDVNKVFVLSVDDVPDEKQAYKTEEGSIFYTPLDDPSDSKSSEMAEMQNENYPDELEDDTPGTTDEYETHAEDPAYADEDWGEEDVEKRRDPRYDINLERRVDEMDQVLESYDDRTLELTVKRHISADDYFWEDINQSGTGAEYLENVDPQRVMQDAKARLSEFFNRYGHSQPESAARKQAQLIAENYAQKAAQDVQVHDSFDPNPRSSLPDQRVDVQDRSEIVPFDTQRWLNRSAGKNANLPDMPETYKILGEFDLVVEDMEQLERDVRSHVSRLGDLGTAFDELRDAHERFENGNLNGAEMAMANVSSRLGAGVKMVEGDLPKDLLDRLYKFERHYRELKDKVYEYIDQIGKTEKGGGHEPSTVPGWVQDQRVAEQVKSAINSGNLERAADTLVEHMKEATSVFNRLRSKGDANPSRDARRIAQDVLNIHLREQPTWTDLGKKVLDRVEEEVYDAQMNVVGHFASDDGVRKVQGDYQLPYGMENHQYALDVEDALEQGRDTHAAEIVVDWLMYDTSKYDELVNEAERAVHSGSGTISRGDVESVLRPFLVDELGIAQRDQLYDPLYNELDSTVHSTMEARARAIRQEEERRGGYNRMNKEDYFFRIAMDEMDVVEQINELMQRFDYDDVLDLEEGLQELYVHATGGAPVGEQMSDDEITERWNSEYAGEMYSKSEKAEKVSEEERSYEAAYDSLAMDLDLDMYVDQVVNPEVMQHAPDKREIKDRARDLWRDQVEPTAREILSSYGYGRESYVDRVITEYEEKFMSAVNDRYRQMRNRAEDHTRY